MIKIGIESQEKVYQSDEDKHKADSFTGGDLERPVRNLMKNDNGIRLNKKKDIDDLEKEVRIYLKNNFTPPTEEPLQVDETEYAVWFDDFVLFARHIAEWQKDQMEERWLKDREVCFWDGVEEGRKVTEARMMIDDYNKIKQTLALGFMQFLDNNRPEGKMCLSNGECADIDKAFSLHDWGKIARYIQKYSQLKGDKK